MPIISLVNIHKAFGNEVVFGGIDAKFFRGEKVGLVGANGCGKTTIFRLILGEIEADVGEVRKGKGIRIGYLPQEASFDGTKTVLEEMHSGLEELFAVGQRMEEVSKRLGVLSGKSLDDAMREYDRLTHAFEIGGGFTYESKTKSILAGLGFQQEHFHVTTDELSGGQLSRLGLGKVLLGDTDVLLLDEPTNHLDVGHQLSVLDLICKLNQQTNMTVISVFHDLNLASEYCHRLMVLDKGQVESLGSPRDVLTSDMIHKVYGAKVLTEKNPVSQNPHIILAAGLNHK
ncbi:MAG: ABC-F family ATP-binding cassette domain-containing protein [Planctomycetes bacterium]|nr:ABC-F family ATP-binding cassette domain-containing protein [Planctomycetota bacterium]